MTLLPIADKFEAEAMCRRPLEGYEKVLGRDHPDTFASVDNLGAVLENLGDYERANGMYQRALEGRKKVLGATIEPPSPALTD